ncbi:MAG TPA: ATP-binding protein [Polyangiaceae bacterium]|nr:ATP-binding protein [Polyangiaceae bacterium]
MVLPSADPYVEVNRRLNALNGAGAAAITALTAASIWGQWRALAVVAGIQVLVIPFNLWVNLVYLPKKGRVAEVPRVLVNIATSLLVNHVAGWPAPAWLWLPFIALAFDQFDRRVANLTLLGFCFSFDLTALVEHVPLVFPLCSTALALFSAEVSRLRFSVIRDMLLASERQRRELEQAHASLHEAHVELKHEALARQEAERELQHAHKLEAVGRLAAGIAHEINSPVQFVGDSIAFVRDATADVMQVLEKHQALRRAVLASAPEPELARLAGVAAECEASSDLAYVVEHAPKALERALDGLGRVTTIVSSMKEFAHPDRKEMTPADINHAVETTLTIARNEYKYVADVTTELGVLPPVRCHLGDVNQAILNVIVNAGHAIAEVVEGTDRRGRITVRTRRDGGDVVIAIADTGGGIPAPIRERIFEPFFTTKEVGKGTGQGLAIARSIVVAKHGGALTFETEVGKGTTFYLRLPIGGLRAAETDAAA